MACNIASIGNSLIRKWLAIIVAIGNSLIRKWVCTTVFVVLQKSCSCSAGHENRALHPAGQGSATPCSLRGLSSNNKVKGQVQSNGEHITYQ